MNRALGSLGLAMRSGRVQCGEAVCDRLIKTGEAKLILIDGGISAGSRKAITDACRYYGVPWRAVPAGELGQAVGKPGRRTAAVTDETFAARLSAMLGPDDEIKE